MSLGVVAGVVVGVLLLVSGGAKIAAGPRWPAQAAALGAPRAVVPFVPWVELALGALVAAGVARTVTGVAAAVLVTCFTALLVVRLAQGKRPPCACFGRYSTRPIGPGSVARNVVIIALALLAALA